MDSKMTESRANNLTGKKKITIIVAVVAFIVVFSLMVIIVINSGFRTAKGTFGYEIKFDNRTFEFKTSNGSIDMYQIRDLSKAKSEDCYMYVATYDKNQDLNEVLKVVNETDGIKRSELKDVKIGKNGYNAKYTTWTDKGGTMCMYFVAYKDTYISISTLTDKGHSKQIEKMLASLIIYD